MSSERVLFTMGVLWSTSGKYRKRRESVIALAKYRV